MIMHLRARPGLMTAVGIALAALLLLMGECNKSDDGPGSYKPTGGDTIWHFASVVRTPPYALPASTRVGLLGDSILASVELPSPADHFDAQLAGDLRIDPGRVPNGAVSGLTLVGPHPNLVDRAPAFLGTLSPGDVLVLDIGMNDACNESPFSLSTFTAAYAALVGRAQALGLRVLVGQVTPVVPALWSCELPREQINAWIWATYPHAIVLRYPDALSAPGVTWIDPNKVTADGKHPNELGTAEMASLTASAVLAPVAVHVRASRAR